MTFGEARDILRNDVLAEASENYYTPENLLAYLTRAAKELALMYMFPRALGSANVLADATSFSLPADAETIDLNEVAYDGFQLALAPYRIVSALVTQSSVGQPRYYNFDARRAGTVLVAPAFPRDGVVTFEYVKEYDVSAVTTASEIWGGLFPAYHELVVHAAGVKAFDASLEAERSQYWAQRLSQGVQLFSAYLNKQALNEVTGQEVRES